MRTVSYTHLSDADEKESRRDRGGSSGVSSQTEGGPKRHYGGYGLQSSGRREAFKTDADVGDLSSVWRYIKGNPTVYGGA